MAVTAGCLRREREMAESTGAGRAGCRRLRRRRRSLPRRASLTGNGAVGELLDRQQDSGRRRRRRRAAEPAAPKPDLSKVTARKNLNETAFFFPQLTSDSNGVVRMTFTMPEALTKWRFLGFAHDQSVRSGYLEGHAVTAKDLMVQPNPPRFLREGDTVEFTVKVSNQTDKPLRGKVRLTFNQALNRPAGGQAARQHQARAGLRHPGQGIAQLRLAHPRARRLRLPDLQGRRRGGQRVRRRGRLPAGALPPHPGDRVAAAADSRPGDEEVRVHQTAQVRQLEDAPEPEPVGADGVQPGVVCGAGAAVPDGISLRVQRADLQPALRQRAGAHHRQQRPEDPPHLRPVEEHARARKPACRRTRTSRR